MPANVGEMFYTGAIPWHKEGIALAKPASLDEAMKVGGLDWEVGEVELLTADRPPSLVPKRKALVRLDRPAGDEQRVVGVVHRDFVAIQNRDAATLFDALFGEGKDVYHTGGYLGVGEVIWLLAEMKRPVELPGKDVVQPYALMTNSHDGSRAFTISLTTIRVVCQNTLSLALREKLASRFSRAHQGSFKGHAAAAQEFVAAADEHWNAVGQSFRELSSRQCSADQFASLLKRLLPDPVKPRNAERNPRILVGWERQCAETRKTRSKITELRDGGKGVELEAAAGTFWGALNAVIEYVDHNREVQASAVSYALLGAGMDLKRRAFREMQQAVKAA
jgi:phage/plasmid-like protein (TIGR03299 family)